jgi:adhesin/invasin
MLSHFSVYGLLVRPPALTVTIGEHPATVPAGESLHLGVSVADVTPNTRSNQPVVWSSTDSSVAAVDGAGLVKSRLAGTVGIVARSGEVADTATLRVVALAPTHLWLSTGSGGSDPIGSTRSPTVRATDDLGNAVSGVRVAWKVTAGGGSLSVDSSTTNVNGVATTNWTLGTGAGANTLEVTAAGLDTVTYTATATAAAASAATSEVSADRDTLAADGVSTATVTVRLRDEFGNPLGSSGGTVTFAAPAQGSVGSVTDRKDGSYTAVYTAGDAVGAVTLTPALDGTPLTNAATLQLVPGDAVASASGLEIAGDSVTADGTSAATITVRLRDGQGRSTTSLPAGASLLASADNGAAVGPLADQGDGVYAASVTSTVSGPVQVTVTLGGSLVDGSPASIDFVSAGPAGLSVVAGDAQSGEVGTTLAIEPAVKVVDAGGNPLAGVAVEWAVVAGGGSVSADSSVTDGTGVATVAWTLGTSPGADTLSATIAGVTPVVFHATATGGVASGANSSLTAGTAALATGGTTALTLVLRDGFDNPIRGATVSSGATGGTLGTFTETGTGVYTATFTADTIPGSATATATVGSLVETASLTVSAGDAVAARSTLSLDPDTIVADGTSAATATVQLRDAYGNLTTILPDGVSIVRSATNGATIGAFVDQGSGRYTATSSSTTAGSSEISVTLGGSAVQGSPASLLFIPSAADSLSIVAGDAQTAAAGTAVATAPSVRVTDAHGNAVQGAVVKWTVLAGGGSVSADSSTSDASGAASVTWTLGSTAGLDSLRASVAGVDSVTFSATATAGAASKLVLTTQPSSSALSGVALIRQPVVQLRDAGGNAVSESGVQVTASIGSGGGTLGGTTAVTTDASGAATFTDLTLSSTSNGSHTLAFAATGLSTAVSDTINLTQAPSLTLSTVSVAADTLRYGSEDGALNSTTVTVQLKDSNGNDLATAGDSVVVSFPGGYVNTADETQSDTLTYLGGGAYRGQLTAPIKVGTQPIVASVNGQLLADTAHVEVVKTRFRFEAGDTSYYFPTTIGKYLIMPVQDADSLGAQGAGIYSITYRILATGYWPGQLGFGMGLAVYPLAYSSFHDLGSKDGELVFRGRDGLWAAEGVAYSSGATVLRDIGDELRIRVDTRDQSIRFFRKASGDSTFTDFTGTDIRTAFKNIYTNAAGSTKFAVSGICWQPCGLAVVQD